MVACRTPKHYLQHLNVSPDSLIQFYKCAPKVAMPPIDQTSVSMHKHGSSSLQQFNQDAIAVDEVLIEEEYKKAKF